MSIENQLTELTAALKENSALLRDVLAASNNAPAPAPEPAKVKKAKAAPAPEPEPEPTVEETPEPEPEETPEPEPEETPEPETTTRVPAKSTKGDTPHIPASVPAAPGQPAAGEFVDVDEVIAEIQTVVKTKLFEGDTESVKAKWEAIRKGYGVDRISELRGQPAKLVEALKKAKAL